MKKLLLTGACGFIGRHALTLLSEKDYEIHAVTRRNGSKTCRGNNVTWHQVNLLDSPEVSKLIQKVKPTHLLHFGWYTEHGKFWNAGENLEWVSATLHLLQEFNKAGGVRFLGAGSCAEYHWQHGYCVEELTPLAPDTLYGSCKKSVFQIAGKYAKENNISFSWGRVFFVYGPDEKQDRLIAYVTSKLLNSSTATCSSGTQIRDFMHVHDVAGAFVELLDSDLEGAVNIASGNPVTIKRITGLVAEIVGKKDLIEYRSSSAETEEPLMIVGCPERLKKELTWGPVYSLEDGLKHNINWWKNELQIV